MCAETSTATEDQRACVRDGAGDCIQHQLGCGARSADAFADGELAGGMQPRIWLWWSQLDLMRVTNKDYGERWMMSSAMDPRRPLCAGGGGLEAPSSVD